MRVPAPAPHVHRVRLTDGTGTRTPGSRRRTSGSTESALRSLALLVDAYLRGERYVEHQWGLLGARPVLTIDVDGREWQLGGRWSRPPAPDRGPSPS